MEARGVASVELGDKRSRPHALQATSILVGGVAAIVIGFVVTFVGARLLESMLPVVAGFITWALAVVSGLFHLHITKDDLFVVPRAFVAALGGVVAAGALFWLFGPGSGISIQDLVIVGLIVFVALASGRWLGGIATRSLWVRGEFRTTAVLVGSGFIAPEIALELRHRPNLGIDVVDVVDLRDSRSANRVIADSIVAHRPDRLIMGDTQSLDVTAAARYAAGTGCRVYVLPRLFEMGVGNPLFTPDRLRGFPLLRVNRAPHPLLSAIGKRTFDIVVSGSALVIAAPILAVCAVAIKATSPGSVLYWQERIGLGGKPFQVPKLRSMTGGETGDTDWTAEARITPVGKFIRRSALDELPQLWTVLRGDMSLVGPRPERPVFDEKFRAEIPRYSDRLRMRSGLTGLSQIAGLRGDTSIAERTKYDNLYIDQWSLLGDLIILFRTVLAIVNERHYQEEQRELDRVISIDSLDGLEPIESAEEHACVRDLLVPASPSYRPTVTHMEDR